MQSRMWNGGICNMMRSFFRPAAVVVLLLCAGMAQAQQKFATIDQIVTQAITDHKIPGAVVIVGHDGKVVFRRAYGMRSLVPTQEKMTTDTIFDMASLTKCISTATAVMQLYEEGKIG